MRVRILSAIVLSLILIVSASAMNGGGKKSIPTSVTSVEEVGTSMFSNTPDAVANLESGTEVETDNEPITTTDLISRQLFSDYLNLANAGEATNENLDTLAQKYAEELTGLIQTPKLTLLDIKTTADSEYSIDTYSNSLTQIMEDHDADVSKIMGQDTLSNDSLSSSKKLELSYAKTVAALKSLSVPKSVAELHLKLLNILSVSTEAMRFVSMIDEDPVIAFSGITTFNNNFQAESSTLIEINRVIQSYGI